MPKQKFLILTVTICLFVQLQKCSVPEKVVKECFSFEVRFARNIRALLDYDIMKNSYKERFVGMLNREVNKYCVTGWCETNAKQNVDAVLVGERKHLDKLKQ